MLIIKKIKIQCVCNQYEITQFEVVEICVEQLLIIHLTISNSWLYRYVELFFFPVVFPDLFFSFDMSLKSNHICDNYFLSFELLGARENTKKPLTFICSI